ncbi:MAG: hypothetical protein ABI557_14320 [Aureliella sp.]
MFQPRGSDDMAFAMKPLPQVKYSGIQVTVLLLPAFEESPEWG